MISSSLLRVPQGVLTKLSQVRNVRPTIKICKDKFELSIDVHQFTKDEIRVKARPEYVVIEGKQERNTKRGYIIRQFSRKFSLPVGCHIPSMTSTLSPNGVLTVTAQRVICDMNLPCETTVPICCTDKKTDSSMVAVPTTPCGDGTKK